MGALQVIARIHTELPEKFGVPRQSGLVPQLRGRIVFEPAYRNPDAVRGLEDFSHLWLIWQFSGAIRQDWSLRCGRPVWGATAAWGSLPPVLPSVPTIWACPRCGWSGWSRVRRWGRCSMSAAQT